MGTAKYPNRDALRGANDIYLDYMRPFIINHLKQVPGEKVEDLIEKALTNDQLDEFQRVLDETDDIESAIDFSYFPLIIRDNWIIPRNNRKYGFAQWFDGDMTVQNMLWLIKDSRNACEHRGTKDLDSEFVRINLFLIAEVLGKINKPDEQREVEDIRDELFSDDTAERLAATSEQLKTAEAENRKYKKSVAEAEAGLASVESEKREYAEKNAALSEQIDEKEKQRKKLDRQLKKAKAQNDKYKKDITGAKKRLEESEAAQVDYKARCETTDKKLKETESELAIVSSQLSDVQAEKNDVAARLAAGHDLFTTATLGKPEIRSIFPAFATNSRVRILDRRGTDKQSYLLNLLVQKQPTLIYVQSEEKIEQLRELVGPKKAGVIGEHDEQTSGAEETEILKKLENGQLTAVVSSSTISTLLQSHCVEHFVFCHLAPNLDAFFNRCQPAFTSTKDAYLHLIYENEQNIEQLKERYPSEEALRKLYEKFRERTQIIGKFINPEDLYGELCKEDELDMTRQGIETGFSIFEELGFLEQSKEGIRRLSTSRTRLEESEIYCRGEKLQAEAENSPSFQYEHPVEQIWEEILEKVDIDNERILRENNISIDLEEITVESLTESVEGISGTAAGEFVPALEPHGALSQAREPRLSIADRYVTETTESDRDKLAVQIAALRINTTGSKPLAWKAIRAEFGLKNDQFHKVIRHSAGYRKAVIDRIKSLKAQEGGWEYSGKLASLTGIDDISEDELK